MANVLSALRTKLLAVSAISTLVGQRIYADNLVQNATLPAVVMRRISTLTEHTVDDLMRLMHSRIEVNAYGTSRTTAEALYDAFRTSGIFSYRGTTESIYFCGIQLDTGPQSDTEIPTDGNQVHRYITTFDLMVHYKEAT